MTDGFKVVQARWWHLWPPVALLWLAGFGMTFLPAPWDASAPMVMGMALGASGPVVFLFVAMRHGAVEERALDGAVQVLFTLPADSRRGDLQRFCLRYGHHGAPLPGCPKCYGDRT